MLTNKADTIKNLQKENIKFLIPNTKVISVNDWKINKKTILSYISKNFKNEIIIRSSSIEEDSAAKSNAGKFLSIQNINPKNRSSIIKAINKVIRSYGKKNFLKNKVLIQNQIKNVSMSGVLLTHELETEAPYYVINYDDKTKKTDTITSGKDEISNKKLIVYRSGIKSLRSKRFIKLINATADLENKIKNDFLDIEFAVDKKLNIYLFQVRRIVRNKKKKFLLKVKK